MVETGHFALVLAFALSLVQTIVPLFGARLNNQRLMAVGGPVAVTGFALTALSFAALASAYAGLSAPVGSLLRAHFLVKHERPQIGPATTAYAVGLSASLGGRP